MKYFIEAALFALYCQRPEPPRAQEDEILISLPNKKIPAILYTPKNTPKGTILAVNGLAYLGNKDPRFAAVCKSACAVGYTVISPLLQEVTEFKIEKETIDTIREMILAVSSDPKYSPKGKISYIAPSFSGSMGLIAASAPEVNGRLESILTIGAYCNVQSTLDYVMTSPEGDEYGRMILLYNFIKFEMGENREIESALKACVMDGSYGRDSLELPSVLESIKPANRKIFENLRDDSEYRQKIWKKIVENAGKKASFLKDLDVEDKLNSLSCSISVVHGLGDKVVPPQQAVRIAECLEKNKVRLILTPLISHGDVGISLKTIPKIFDLINGFAFFFKQIGRSRFSSAQKRDPESVAA
ncbi:alpha/beta hydrolase [Leptospira fluminis]|uniref:Alpha/beta hydrolase n=1 Tax=Leptospira fluminis TaxID=2484979 RepID=A0A4R9GN69_9LEPT|nr:alpha/beta hydrolase [Leptospira fluminis]TGK17941.1 alpha/beta hydrolase [Leptospira fluminis]